MNPDYFRILYPYTYTFDINDFFDFSLTDMLRVEAKIEIIGTSTILAPLPRWLNFYANNCTF